MFGCSKERLIAGLVNINKAHCAYNNGNSDLGRCDCKYGAGEKYNPNSELGNGCPEIRSVTKILEKMTDDEYEELCKRAGVIISFAKFALVL